MAAPDATIARTAYYGRIAALGLKPLWEVLDALVPERPAPKCVPACWRYRDVRPWVLEAGRLISAEEATRRVLVLENPALPGESRVTGTLYAGLQLLNPGEVAPAHRHTQSALRFVLEGHGAYTSVDGERHYMAPGDVVLTPAWSWHDHGNEGGESVIWLDALDIPLVQMLDAGFCENLGEARQAIERPVGDSLARYGANMLPPDHQPRSLASPVFAYPYTRTREALAALSDSAPPNPCHGYKLRYSNPVNGGHALPTIASFMQLLPARFRGAKCRSTDATVYVAFEGQGRSQVGDRIFEWGPRDLFVVPSWCEWRHEADDTAVLFSYSDRVVQERLGLWREAC